MADILTDEQVREHTERLKNDPLFRPTYADFVNVIATLRHVQEAYSHLNDGFLLVTTHNKRLLEENARLREALVAYESECMCRVTDKRRERCIKAQQTLATKGEGNG